ncbi:hypothetical protein Aple_024420 [Acrocarpospora pleiomorpha]|uniref:SnoaL-like domain-containing protein n=1 Tax=Acrocarpospora pleiomorpha TaxID=90975 RepID=A0A5M3XFX9_9ACTN|nr:nuclear transport factor 2 family protein [Acrocarpospora pleiomorpha]GES19546.1 hypothetical protein Aple_024420 [Acrocarpospora pleiomorpha]
MYTIEEISAHLEIRDVLQRYCRGCDRRDPELVKSAYFPDAVDIRAYDAPDATPAEFARRLVDGFGDLPEFSQHHITNVIIDLDIEAGVANVETYNLVMHPVGPQTSLVLKPEDSGTHLRIMGGRALDRFERRDGEWRIARRVMLIDWSRDDLPGNPVWATIKQGLRPGGLGADPSYAHFQGA